MSYTALYRKFRPATFEDVKGQEHIVKTLKNQITSGRIGHAYLFCGTRGTGKTTIAKIVAKAVNCEHPINGSPCGECATCKAIAEGASMNVVEIDAASNNSVDNIREIVNDVRYSPTEGKYRVYIIDEVHMLSAGAFNALLKTLEEPPAYVIFILATTEVQKIPVTILSRCQRYDFKRLTVEEISQRIKELMQAESIEADDKAIRYISVCADGAMRDALSLLDRCIAYYIGEKLTYDKVLEAVGTVDVEVFGNLIRDIFDEDVAGALKIIDDMVVNGRELTQFTKDFTWYMRNMLLAKTSESLFDSLEVPEEHKNVFLENTRRCEAETLMRYIRIFSDLSNQIRFAQQKRVNVEIAIIKLCKPQMETDYQSLIQRVSALEGTVEKGISFSQAGAGQSNIVNSSGSGLIQQGSVKGSESSVITKSYEELEKATSDDMKIVGEHWDDIVAKRSDIFRGIFADKEVKKTFGNGNELVLYANDDFRRKAMEERLPELKAAIQESIGKNVEIRIAVPKKHEEIVDEVDILNSVKKKVLVEEVDSLE